MQLSLVLLWLPGAQFSGALRRGETTHLVCEEPTGAKYTKAQVHKHTVHHHHHRLLGRAVRAWALSRLGC